MKRDTERNEQHNKFTERQNREAVKAGEADMAREPLAANNQRLFDLVRHQRQELFLAELITVDELDELMKEHSAVARLEDYDSMRQELDMLKGNPEAVHKGALAAISALKQMVEMRDEITALRKALFPFAELPTVGADDTVGLDVEFSQLITNREILNARDCFKARIPEGK